MKTWLVAILVITIGFNTLISCATDGMARVKAQHHQQIMDI